ncbi:hypothetical protein DEO72_LG4g131 [Vigna unguiculata]|uniref:Uncharacterized protein n=1 Tax=Vigna unguiculata TaxID=3917 RepID=A0A4D6LKF2_VIGUN|nr:hypothetical protein DEO72_LG4g131 [Vigna unguiculata]
MRVARGGRNGARLAAGPDVVVVARLTVNLVRCVRFVAVADGVAVVLMVAELRRVDGGRGCHG